MIIFYIRLAIKRFTKKEEEENSTNQRDTSVSSYEYQRMMDTHDLDQTEGSSGNKISCYYYTCKYRISEHR